MSNFGEVSAAKEIQEFGDELDRTEVISQNFKYRLFQLMMHCVSKAFDRGLAEGKASEAEGRPRRRKKVHSCPNGCVGGWIHKPGSMNDLVCAIHGNAQQRRLAKLRP